MGLPFVVEKTGPTVVTVRMNPCKAGFEQYFLLRSDAHHDNVHCDQQLESRHLEEAKERNAGIIDIGDLACAMQGRYDPRADRSQLRPELQSGDYFDALTRYNAAFYEPYAANFVMLSRGNHEETVLQRNQTDLSERLAERLRAKGS